MLLLDGLKNASASNSSRMDQKDVLVLEPYVVPVFFGLIFVSGVVGNGSLMFIICRYKSMRNLPNIFVFNLALGDLFVLLFTVPFTTSIYMFDSWPFGEFVCKASEFAKVLLPIDLLAV
jgi:bombesin receptor subtype-3